MAFLDRLVEGAIILKIKGHSYRARRQKIAVVEQDPTLILSYHSSTKTPVTTNRHNGPFSGRHRY